MAEFGLQKNTLKSSSTWRVVIATFILALSLSACGKKGPLYLPEEQTDKPTENMNIPAKPIDNQTTQQDTP
ncbi:MAG: lipoprotein [Pseudomonadota bacterium]|nr:lipoprotein [Pseudomonadota bacterium]